MKDERVLDIYVRMKNAYEDYSKCIKYPRRCPNVKVMADYINHVFGEFGYKASAEKVLKTGMWLHVGLPGTEITVKKNGKEVLKTCNASGYGETTDVVHYILELHKKHIPSFERDLKIKSILED
jgi:hypothetical protein